MSFMNLFKKKTIKKVLKFILKYIVPIVTGWIEGDSHAISDAFNSVVSVLF